MDPWYKVATREKRYVRDARLTRTSLPSLWSRSSQERRQKIIGIQRSSSCEHALRER